MFVSTKSNILMLISRSFSRLCGRVYFFAGSFLTQLGTLDLKSLNFSPIGKSSGHFDVICQILHHLMAVKEAFSRLISFYENYQGRFYEVEYLKFIENYHFSGYLDTNHKYVIKRLATNSLLITSA